MPTAQATHGTPDSLYARLDATGAETAVSVILKLRGETCDIDCLYCYEKRKESPGGARITAAQANRLGSLFAGRPLSIELHGGEPLTAGRQHVAAILDALSDQPNVIRVSMQTNGLLLDEEWLDLFDEHCPELEIGLSLDGDAFGNSWRVGYDGYPTYPRVVRSLELLAQRGRQTGIICAVTPRVLGRAPEVIDHLASFRAVTTINLVPCFDGSVTKPTTATNRRQPASRILQKQAVGPIGPDWAIAPEQYTGFVLEAAAHWVATGTFRRIKLEPAVSVIRRLKGLQTRSCHFSDMKCDHVFTLYPDNRFGSCDELPWPQARLTTLTIDQTQSDISSEQLQSPLLKQARSLVKKCLTCDYRDTCGAGCLAVRLRFTQERGDDDNYCTQRMRLIDGTAALLAQPEHPSGMHCTRWRWRPRIPNDMQDVSAFLARWDDPAAARQPARLRISEHGNINTVGQPGTHEADDLDPHHPQWHDGIEPGIRPVVDALTRGWNAVTYDSCQGHAHDDLPGAEPRHLAVGVLPRNRTEYAHLAARLCGVAERVTHGLPTGYSLELGRSELTCRTNGRTFPTLDVRLTPADGAGISAYFHGIDGAVRVLVNALETAPPNSADAVCSCNSSPSAERVAR
ncbi:radical SAM protein [Streptomyces sp. NPDC005393]|uniref:radical SAM/SPASM domain-containing protein n=1 Tax=Streptomyces sp. NPDC005393 TaxID=3157041 RepID=UPI0033A82CE9